jgi:hypothetical protein
LTPSEKIRGEQSIATKMAERLGEMSAVRRVGKGAQRRAHQTRDGYRRVKIESVLEASANDRVGTALRAFAHPTRAAKIRFASKMSALSAP